MQSLVFAATPGFWVPWDLTFHRNHATGMSHNTSFFIGKDYHKSNEINAQAGNGLKSTSQSIRITWGAAGTVAGGTRRFFIPTGTFIFCLVVVWRLEGPSIICQPSCQFCIIPLTKWLDLNSIHTKMADSTAGFPIQAFWENWESRPKEARWIKPKWTTSHAISVCFWSCQNKRSKCQNAKPRLAQDDLPL